MKGTILTSTVLVPVLCRNSPPGEHNEKYLRKPGCSKMHSGRESRCVKNREAREERVCLAPGRGGGGKKEERRERKRAQRMCQKPDNNSNSDSRKESYFLFDQSERKKKG